MQLPSHHQSIPTVVAFSANHHDALTGQRGETLCQKFHDTGAGVFHQDQPGNSPLDGEPVDFAHLRGRQNLHAPVLRVISMVISSCKAGDPVHSSTASIARATNSLDSAP